jgi:unsaturated rhamnogalacturonyl hydrolase
MAASRSGLRSRLRAAGELLLEHRFQGWFYGDSIGFEGLLAASDVLGDPRYREFARGFIHGWATRAEPYREMDNTAPGLVMTRFAETDPLSLDAARRLADHLRTRPKVEGVYVSFASAPLREPYGGFELSLADRRLLEAPGPGVYVDCLHFDPPFFVALGVLLGDTSLIDDGAEQALGYVRLLQDAGSGLFRHFYLEQTGAAYVLGWSRGQGWALLGLLDVLERLPVGHRSRAGLIAAAARLARALRDCQRVDGSWSAVAHVRSSADESSTAAFLAAAFWQGIRLDVLDRGTFEAAAEQAWSATLGSLTSGGKLEGVSSAVWSSTDDRHYHHVPRGEVVPWGQGPVLVAAARRPGGIG